jgi:hypothetical protein
LVIGYQLLGFQAGKERFGAEISPKSLTNIGYFYPFSGSKWGAEILLPPFPA